MIGTLPSRSQMQPEVNPTLEAGLNPYTVGVKPGTVMAIHTSDLFGTAIRIGADLIDEPAAQNHIAVLHHQDSKGTWWCLEGRPGGVGWRDATAYLTNRWTITNRHQPLMDEQRAEICLWMEKLVNTHYDWRAILEDGLRDIHIPDPWGERWVNGEINGGVACSSASAFSYAHSRAAYPRNIDEAHVQPADWVKFIMDNNYA